MAVGGRSLCPAFGLDLGSADGRTDDQLAKRIAEAIDHHHVVKLRGIDWDEARQLEITSRIGTVIGSRRPSGDVGPSVRHERGADRYAHRWHADLSWSSTDAVSVLVCTQADPDPEPTQFLDTSVALDALDVDLLARIRGRTVTHDLRRSRRIRPDGPRSIVQRLQHRFGHRLGRFAADGLDDDHASGSDWSSLRIPEQQTKRGTAYPIIDRCARTGSAFLRLGDHAWAVSGLGTKAAQVLLADLQEAIDHPTSTWQQDWTAGDVVIYDNRMILHRRVVMGGRRSGRVLRRTLAEWSGPA